MDKTSLRISIAKKKIRGLPLTDEEKAFDAKQLKQKRYTAKEKAIDTKQSKPVKKRYTAKEKALWAIDKRCQNIDNPKWMQKPIDFNDKTIPVGKRRVAYVRYLTYKGHSLAYAKYEAVKWIH